MKMDVKNRESFKEMMCEVANKHGCSIVFEPGFHSIDSMGMTIVKGTHIRYFYIFWPSVENQTQAATSIWASFFDTYYEQRKSDKFWTKENPNLYISTDCNSGKSLDDERTKNIYKRMVNSMYGANPYYRPEIKNVIFNDPATIVFWTDGTKTVVKCQEGDIFDPEKGLTMAIAKKVYGNKGSYCNVIKKWREPYHEKQKEKNDLVTRICDLSKKAALAALDAAMTEASIANAKEQEEKKHRNLYKYDDSKPVTIDCEKSYKNDRKYELIYETLVDAEDVLNGMSEIIDKYGFATVADLYDISGLPGAYYTDSIIGWKGSIKESIIKRVRDGYVIDLPKPEVLE